MLNVKECENQSATINAHIERRKKFEFKEVRRVYLYKPSGYTKIDSNILIDE